MLFESFQPAYLSGKEKGLAKSNFSLARQDLLLSYLKPHLLTICTILSIMQFITVLSFCYQIVIEKPQKPHKYGIL